jgi:hypothetical protein
MGLQSPGSPAGWDFGTPVRESQESQERKAIWMWVPWRVTEYTIRGKVVASPKFGPWWILCVRVARGSSQHQRCSNYALTTLCGLCAGPCEWISLSILPSPIPELKHAPLPLKVLWAREHIPTPPSSAVFHLDSPLNPSRSWECVNNPSFGVWLCHKDTNYIFRLFCYFRLYNISWLWMSHIVKYWMKIGLLRLLSIFLISLYWEKR